MSNPGRNLWGAVVLKAHDDLDTAKYGSSHYITAKSFFLAPGKWAESRQAIADELELHPDDLMRLGRATLAARHLRDGPEPTIVTRGEPPRIYTRPVLRLTNPVPAGPKPPWPTITATMPANYSHIANGLLDNAHDLPAPSLSTKAPEPEKPKRKPGRPRKRRSRIADPGLWLARFLASKAA